MILKTEQPIMVQREEILCDAARNLASELKLIEPTTYALFFQYGQMPEVYNLVTATLIRHFLPGKMNFACTGDTLITWNNTVRVALDLEFENCGIFAFFRLILGGTEPSVELHHISFLDSSDDPGMNTQMLHLALSNAKRNS